MKIVITRTSKKKQSFEVAVLDGVTPIHRETVDGIKLRDETVWKLADLYGALDIEIVEAKPKQFKLSEIPSIPVLDEEDAEHYFDHCEEVVYDRIVVAIAEGLATKRSTIRLFELNGTGLYITSEQPTWKGGLEQALQYYIKIEAYERCAAIHDLMEKL